MEAASPTALKVVPTQPVQTPKTSTVVRFPTTMDALVPRMRPARSLDKSILVSVVHVQSKMPSIVGLALGLVSTNARV